MTFWSYLGCPRLCACHKLKTCLCTEELEGLRSVHCTNLSSQLPVSVPQTKTKHIGLKTTLYHLSAVRGLTSSPEGSCLVSHVIRVRHRGRWRHLKTRLGWTLGGFVTAGLATSAGRAGAGGQQAPSLRWDLPLAQPERVVCLFTQETASLRAKAIWFLVT